MVKVNQISDGFCGFFAKYVLDIDIIARMIFSLLHVKTGLGLSMDGDNWKFGDFNINILNSLCRGEWQNKKR